MNANNASEHHLESILRNPNRSACDMLSFVFMCLSCSVPNFVVTYLSCDMFRFAGMDLSCDMCYVRMVMCLSYLLSFVVK